MEINEIKISNNLTIIELLDLVAPNYSVIEGEGEKITARIVKINPNLAKKILEKNLSNRPLSKGNVKYLSKEITNDNWKFDGESIKLDSNGNLLDGQHRLDSIIKTGKTITCLILTGLKPSVFSVLDTGRKRTGSDALGVLGVENSTIVSSTIRLIHQFDKGSYGEGGSISRSLSNQEIIDFYLENPEINNSSRFGASLYKKSNSEITPSLISTFHYLFSQKNEEQAVEFLTKLCLGTNLETNSPITALRNKLIKARLNKNYRMIQSEIVRNIIVAWNKFRKNEKINKLIVHSSMDTVIIE